MEQRDKTMVDAIFDIRGDTFQNSPIHLLFFEKVNENMAPNLTAPELTSMSYCRLRSDSSLNLPKSAYELELQLVLRGVTAQFVSEHQYKQLQFILGLKPNSSTEIQQTYKEVLELFKKFHTNSPENFQNMLGALDFPFIYNKKQLLKTDVISRIFFKSY